MGERKGNYLWKEKEKVEIERKKNVVEEKGKWRNRKKGGNYLWKEKEREEKEKKKTVVEEKEEIGKKRRKLLSRKKRKRKSVGS